MDVHTTLFYELMYKNIFWYSINMIILCGCMQKNAHFIINLSGRQVRRQEGHLRLPRTRPTGEGAPGVPQPSGGGAAAAPAADRHHRDPAPPVPGHAAVHPGQPLPGPRGAVRHGLRHLHEVRICVLCVHACEVVCSFPLPMHRLSAVCVDI